MKKILFLVILITGVFIPFSIALAIGDNGIITYEQLKQYKELFDPTIKGVDSGIVPVKIEAVIGEVTDGEDGEYSFDMWIKGEECYHYEKKK